jgi:thiamine biosynthesis lipoprotein ApbE
MGPEKGLQLVEELPGVEGVFITVDLEVLISSGLVDQVELNLKE